MSRESKVFVLVLSGRERDALALAQQRYPACAVEILSKTSLRERKLPDQWRMLRQLRGKALLIFADSLHSLREPMMLKWTVLVHRCRETVLADSRGAWEVSNKETLLRLLPASLLAVLTDLVVLTVAWIALQVFQAWLRISREPEARAGAVDVAFLLPTQAGLEAPGGAQTHVTGFLSGLEEEGARAEVFSGQPVETICEVHYIPGSRRLSLLREAATLSYNLRFIVTVRRLLAKKGACCLYQRHGRFLFGGAVLSRLLGIPLVLEYNGSEVWIAKHWDPARFTPWLRLCEKVSIRAASLIVVVSQPLKQELMDAGVPEGRILLNPNGVDPEVFRPGLGGESLRKGLGIRREDVVVGFVGTFSYWHGVTVLEQAISTLLAGQRHDMPLKFLLVGDGLLAPKLRKTLDPYTRQGRAIFAGTVPHRTVPMYLDAADILVSPHIPMPEGEAFFGSPTKLFEYMAMGKAIVASSLNQIAEVLNHERTALLVKPGDRDELVKAVRRLAADAQLRAKLGRNARQVALEQHTWRQNASGVLQCLGGSQRDPNGSRCTAEAGGRPHRSLSIPSNSTCHENSPRSSTAPAGAFE